MTWAHQISVGCQSLVAISFHFKSGMPNSNMSQKTLNKINLTALGPDKLAGLLLEVSTGSADIKRRLRLELSFEMGSAELGIDVRKRLVAIRKSKTYAGWRKRKSLVKDLQILVDMICDKIAVDDPSLALELLWEFVAIAPSVSERVDDSRGEVAAVFEAACARFAEIAPLAVIDPRALASQVWVALLNNVYGEFDGIIDLVAPALGKDGLAHLKQSVITYQDEPDMDGCGDHAALTFLRSLRGEDTQPNARKIRQVKAWLQDIAVAQGDAEAYVAQYTDQDLLLPDVAAEIAQIWMDKERHHDVLNLLNAVDVDSVSDGVDAWDAAYVRCLSELDRVDDAQSHRWLRFDQTLSTVHLRNYLKLLPDFTDIEVEDRAKAYAFAFPKFQTALSFFIDWPDLILAARLIETRTNEINGDFFWRLLPAVESLRTRHPLAATLVLRAIITHALAYAKTSRYVDAAEQLMDCAVLDTEIADYGPFQTHEDYFHHLKASHQAKIAFWKKVKI